MATTKFSDIVSRLGRRPPGPTALDPDLLARFLATRDEQAFALIVRRHGPMVFGVCRRVTGNYHLAEDAFQAVFVVLAAKAGTVRPRTALAAWLYGVAYRTALRARTVSDRRRRREAPVETLPEVPHQPSDPSEVADVAAVLDEEIARLPEHLRVAVVLCELEEQSRQEAAGQLGIPEGTLSSRLASARKALAGRLRQRGVVLSAAGLSAAFTQTATAAALPATLAARAMTALTPELIPPAVGILTQGVLRIMFLDKLKTAVLIAVTVGLAACAGLAAAPAVAGADSPPAPKPAPPAFLATTEPVPEKAEAKPLPKGPNKLLVFRKGYLALIDPDGKNERRVSTDPDLYHTSGARLSPDGTMLAIPLLDPLPPDDGVPGAKLRTATLHVRGIDEKEPGTNLGVTCIACVWSPDGSEIACSQVIHGPDKKSESTNVIINVKTKEKTALKLPDGHVITDWSRDGKVFVVTKGERKDDRMAASVYLANRDTGESKLVSGKDEIGLFGMMSPDGKRVLYMVMRPKEETPAELKARQEAGGRAPDPIRVVMVFDVAAGKATPVADVPLNAEIQAYCWSPDGKRIAYTWRQIHEGKLDDIRDKETESHLVVCDPDGKNQKTIATEKGPYQAAVTIGGVDWR